MPTNLVWVCGNGVNGSAHILRTNRRVAAAYNQRSTNLIDPRILTKRKVR